MHRFIALELALEIIRKLRPIVRKIRTRDRRLATQLSDAGSSGALNLGEGVRRTGKDRIHLWNIASGSEEEVRTALRVASAWGYVEDHEIEVVLGDIDRLQRIVWKMTR